MSPVPVRSYGGVLPSIRRRGHPTDVQSELSVPVAEIGVSHVGGSMPPLRTPIEATLEERQL
jgi:hypothetical protein